MLNKYPKHLPSCWPIHVPNTNCDEQESETSVKEKQVWKEATDKNKVKGTTNNRATMCFLCAPLFFFWFSIYFFLFLLFFWYFFSAWSREEQTTKNLNYTKSALFYEKYAKTCAPRSLIFLIKFRNSNFCEPSLARTKQI